MVGIAGYKCIIRKKRPKLNGHIPTVCNKLIEFVMNFDVKLLSNAIAVLLLAFSTPIWIPARRLPGFAAKIGVMETVFPHCQQTFQHKCGAINDVMQTSHRFPWPFPALRGGSAGRAHLSAAAAHFCLPAPSRTARSARAVCPRRPHRTILHRPALHRTAPPAPSRTARKKPRERSLPGRGAMGRQCRLTRR